MLLASLQRLLPAAASASSHYGATAVLSALQLHQRCWFSSRQAAHAAKQVAVDLATLTPEQQQHVKALQYLVQRPLEAAHNAAMLTALTASYRDLYVIMDQMHKKDILGIPRPLLDEPPAPSSSSLGQQQQEAEQPPAINHTQMFYPVRDFTKLPDAPVPYGGWLRNHLKHRYMSKVTAFAQLLPNHLEVSYQTGAMITLWPAMEAYYPGFMDVEGMIRYLKPELKRTRWRRSSRNKVVRSRLGWQRQVPYHNRRKHV